MEITLQTYAIEDSNGTTIALIETPKHNPSNRLVSALQKHGLFRGELAYHVIMDCGNRRLSFLSDNRRKAMSKFYEVVSSALETKADDDQRAQRVGFTFEFTDDAHAARIASKL